MNIELNTLLTTGIILTLFGSLIAYFRAVPGMIYRKVRSYFIFTIEIHQNDQAFTWFMLWLHNHPSTAKSKTLAVQTETIDGVSRVKFTPLGMHFFKYKGNYVWVQRSREKQQNGGTFIALYETLTITTLARNRGFLEELVDETRQFNDEYNRGKIIIYSSRHDYWNTLAKKSPRDIATVVLPKDVKDNTLEDSKEFLNNESWYKDRGVPYRRGYLLSGPPGNGKTSLVFSIASALKKNIAILNLASPDLTDSGLLNLLSETPENAIILIEDIDTIFKGRDSLVKDGKLTFSGLLNAIDGVASSEGRVLFMTTNHEETLDPALIRPGRADKLIGILPPTKDLIREMYLRFNPKDEEGATMFSDLTTPGTSAAKIQELLVAESKI